MITALFAVDDSNGMGLQGTMPWPRNREDMIWFRNKTQNHAVVMGKKTWESTDMPIPLPKRVNVLITHNFIDREDIIQLRGDICEALLHLTNEHKFEEIFVIGGPQILMQAKPVIDQAFITRIPGEHMNDTIIDLDQFLDGFDLKHTQNLNTCRIEEYTKCKNI